MGDVTTGDVARFPFPPALPHNIRGQTTIDFCQSTSDATAALQRQSIGDLATTCRESRMDIAFYGCLFEEARPACLAGRGCRWVDCFRTALVTRLARQPARRRYAGADSIAITPATAVSQGQAFLRAGGCAASTTNNRKNYAA